MGLRDHPTTERPPALTKTELALPANRIFRGLDPETDSVSCQSTPDLCGWIEGLVDKRLSPRAR